MATRTIRVPMEFYEHVTAIAEDQNVSTAEAVWRVIGQLAGEAGSERQSDAPFVDSTGGDSALVVKEMQNAIQALAAIATSLEHVVDQVGDTRLSLDQGRHGEAEEQDGRRVMDAVIHELESRGRRGSRIAKQMRHGLRSGDLP